MFRENRSYSDGVVFIFRASYFLYTKLTNENDENISDNYTACNIIRYNPKFANQTDRRIIIFIISFPTRYYNFDISK